VKKRKKKICEAVDHKMYRDRPVMIGHRRSILKGRMIDGYVNSLSPPFHFILTVWERGIDEL
jgi:hypothetical protein